MDLHPNLSNLWKALGDAIVSVMSPQSSPKPYKGVHSDNSPQRTHHKCHWLFGQSRALSLYLSSCCLSKTSPLLWMIKEQSLFFKKEGSSPAKIVPERQKRDLPPALIEKWSLPISVDTARQCLQTMAQSPTAHPSSSKGSSTNLCRRLCKTRDWPFVYTVCTSCTK